MSYSEFSWQNILVCAPLKERAMNELGLPVIVISWISLLRLFASPDFDVEISCKWKSNEYEDIYLASYFFNFNALLKQTPTHLRSFIFLCAEMCLEQWWFKGEGKGKKQAGLGSQSNANIPSKCQSQRNNLF